jgi:acyl-CoA synthetase (AMP-forming)/AMP-acid ligase II
MLTATARRLPSREAVVCGGQRLTFAELDARSSRLANALLSMGLGVGDRIALHMANSVAVVEAMAAVLKTGAIIVPISTRLAPPEIRYMLEDTEPFAVVYSPDVRDTVRHCAAGLDDIRLVVAGAAKTDELALDDLIAGASDRTPDLPPFFPDDALLSYTSGTTGRPKGAVSTHRNLVISLGWINAAEWRLSARDRTLCATPMAHRTGMARVASSFCLGSTLIVQERFDPAETVKLIARERATHIGVVPTIARMLLPAIEADPESCATLRCMLATGEVFPMTLKERLFAALPQLDLHSFYSQTEAGVVTNLRPEEQLTHAESIGQPINGVDVRLVDSNFADVATGDTGEILVRCGAPGEYTVVREYFRRPEDTRNAFVDGWIRTGDMARMDGNGYFYFVDRLKDMIVSGGLNIYSCEVEDALLLHPAVSEAAVIGVPDGEFGEAVMAFVVPRDGETPDADMLIEHCRAHIASYKKPRHVRLVDALPRNSTGKVAKPALREQVVGSRD